MGESKHNPTAIAVAKGEIPRKSAGDAKRELEMEMFESMRSKLFKKLMDAQGTSKVGDCPTGE